MTTYAGAAERTTIETINPSTGETLARHPTADARLIDERLGIARRAFLEWRETAFAERSAHLRRIAQHLRAEKTRIGRLATAEMGKPISEAEAEVEKCALGCDFYAEHAERMLADQRVATNAAQSYVAFRPLGAVLAIMPWNFPFWQVFRFAAPALMAGNVGVLKHASNVSECALEIERVFAACELPTGVFTTLIVPSKEVDAIISDPRVAAVTLTGSDAAGSAVAASAGREIKKTVLELGGSDAFIVLADADIEQAAKIGVKARFQNAGQSCICAKRFIIEAPVYDAFIEAFVAEAKRLRVGDPNDPATQMGPMARHDLRDALHAQVQSTIAKGARLVLGGEPLEGRGAFYPPTVVADVTPEMTMFREETFGPAAAMVRARDVDEAIALANDSQYGLGGALWTRDIERAQRLAGRVESGGVFINGMTASDPRLPFGGVKRSGYGRELSSYGIHEFVNIQTVWIGPAQPQAQQPSGKPAE